MSKEDKVVAHFEWASSNQQPCFCDPAIQALDIERLKPTPETLAALFGVRRPETITLLTSDGEPVEMETEEVDEEKKENSTSCWKLEAGKQYQVHATSSNAEEDVVVPINQMFGLLPGDTDDEKSDGLLKFATNFYDKVWNDPATPVEFRDKFYSRFSTAKIQAFRQYNWLLEAFGGPTLVGDQIDSVLKPKVMAKHTSSRMSMHYAVTWLEIMKKTIDEEIPNDQPKLKEQLGLYWLHFYAYFPYNDEERRELRRLVAA